MHDILICHTLLQSDPLPPPIDIHLVIVSPEHLVFSWTSVQSNCSTLQYNIDSDCGTCLDVIEKTVNLVTCSFDLSAVIESTMLCSFGISSVICGNISGNLSAPLDVILKGIGIKHSSHVNNFNAFFQFHRHQQF